MSSKSKKRDRHQRSAEKKVNASLNISRRTRDTENHWHFVRPETPAAAVRPKDRADARMKAREEYLNNPYGSGFAETFALYTIGSGPRLQFLGFEKYLERSVSPKMKLFVETMWRDWSDSVRLAKTLRLGMRSLVVDGEVFLMESANPKRSIFGINYSVIDPQRIGNPNGKPWTPQMQDGLFFDEFGNLEAFCLYDVPKYDTSYYDSGRYTIVPADQIHFAFKENLPESTRGWSWYTPVLESMGRLRDYEDSVIESAKSASNVFATIETQAGYYDSGDLDVQAESYYAWQNYPVQRNKIIQLPPETTMKSFQPSQPTTNVPDFVSSQVARLGRGMGLTRNRATGSSHEYNFASGKLDSQPFDLLISCLQSDLFELDIMDKLFADFYAALIPILYDRFPDEEIPASAEAEWKWRWPKAPLVDEEAQSRTDALRVRNCQATVREVWEERHPDSNFDDMLPFILEDRSNFPELYGAPAGDKEGIAPSASGTAVNEPKVDSQTPGVPNE